MRTRIVLLAVLGVTILSGCGTCSRSAGRSFGLGRDTFAFRNELRWNYEFGTNGVVVSRNPLDPPAKHGLRCFPMTRAAREFFYHARFDPHSAKLEARDYRKLAGKIVRRNSRCPSAEADRIVLPGYADLHDFSADHSELLREACGGPVSSYLQRGNWRMVFPVSERRFRKTAASLVNEIQAGRLPIVHVYRFPDTSLNHAIILYHASEEPGRVKFRAYDPNDPGRPAELEFDAEAGTFLFERNRYFAGGPVRVYEVYRGLFY